MRCPQLRSEEVRKDFNDVLTRLGGKEMAAGDVAPRRAYLDGLNEAQRSAYHVAHYLWDAYDDPAAIGAHLSAYDKVRDALGISEKPVPTSQTPSINRPEKGRGEAAPTSAKAIPSSIPDQLFRGSGRADQASPYRSAPVPIAGPARYFAFDQKAAEAYGPEIEKGSLREVVSNPLIITDGKEWRSLTREAGWETPNPFGRGIEEQTAAAAKLQELVKAKGHDGLIVWWDDSTPYDIGPNGENIKLLRNVFGDPQAVSFAKSAAPALPADGWPGPEPKPARAARRGRKAAADTARRIEAISEQLKSDPGNRELRAELTRLLSENAGKVAAKKSEGFGAPRGWERVEPGARAAPLQMTDLGNFEAPKDTELAAAAQREVLERGRLTNLEHLVAIDKDGNVVAFGHGTENMTGINAALQEAMVDPDRQLVVHHNHPGGGSLSTVDIGNLALPGLKAVWAHGHNGVVARGELTARARQALSGRTYEWATQLLYDVAREASNTLERAIAPHIGRGITREDAKHLHWHLVPLALERAGILDYRSNIEASREIDRLGLKPHINKAAADAAWAVFNERKAQEAGDGRRAEPLRHPGDVGTSLGRAQEIAGRRPAQAANDRPRQRGDRAQAARTALPGLAEETSLSREGAGGPPAEPPAGGGAGEPPEKKGALTTIRDKADRFVEQLGNIVRDLQIKTTPMAARDASIEARAIAKDFANAMRQSRATWDLVDQKLAKDFTPAQQERMWVAADAESVAKQKGAEVGDKGVAALPEAERKVVELLQAHGEEKFAEAKALGIFKGEGLPSYVPRMVVRATGEGTFTRVGDRGPAPSLDTIGHGVRTSTPQMRKRKYLTAEETEAAAQAKLGEDVELVRNIRTLPLAIAKLEEAIAGRTLINHIKEIGRQAGEQTVVEGAEPTGINTPHRWFTIDHPAFKTFRPKYVRDGNGEVKLDDAGKVMIAKNPDGSIALEQVPIYVRGDFEGPLRAVLSQQDGRVYRAFMALKTRIITMIMMSPMIHNQVEWGRALPAAPGKVFTGRIYFEGNKAKKDPAQLREAVTDGLAPIGRRGYQMDITSIAEGPDAIKPGRSWTSQLVAFVPGLYSKEAGVATKRAIDKAGDFWHNTLLWDRIGDLQMGLYVHLRDHLIEKGFDRKTASRAAAHWANRYAGALPVEAMSGMARKIANFLMFSRSFTLGNIGAMKDMFVGLPRDVAAQIERDAGLETLDRIKGLARRKAAMIVATDIAMFYVMTSLTQSAINVLGVKGAAATLGGMAAGGVLGGQKGKFPGLALALAGGALGYLITDGDDDRKKKLKREIAGYFRRAAQLMKRIKEHPFEVVNPFGWPGMAQSVSATAENEPGRQDRILVGYQKDGTAIYMRWPVGKIGEEFIGYGTGPLEMIHKKMSTWARPLSEIFSNDRGFGRPVYDKNAETGAEQINNVRLITWHLMSAQLPVDWAESLWDLEHGKGDKTTNLLKTVGPLLGATFSKGAPGGPAMGELYRSEEKFRFRLTQELPALRKQIQAGDIDGAVKRMQELHVPEKLIEYHVGAALDPRSRLGTRRIERFMQSGSEDSRDRFIRQLERGGELGSDRPGRNLGLAPKNPNWRAAKRDPGVFDSKGWYTPPGERAPSP